MKTKHKKQTQKHTNLSSVQSVLYRATCNDLDICLFKFNYFDLDESKS